MSVSTSPGGRRVTIGVDFGTESGRVLLLDLGSAEELAVTEVRYPHGVIDQRLPSTGGELPPDTALQDPGDYLEVLYRGIPEALAAAKVAADEVIGIGVTKPEADVRPCLARLSQLAGDMHSYFYKKLEVADLLEGVNDLTVQFESLQPFTQGTFVARLKQEQSNLRRTLIRIHIIRETNFVSTGYLLADMITVLLCVWLVLTSVDPFYEGLFFAGVIAYLMIFLLLLIRDLDNPFGYYESGSSADVTLQPLEDTIARLAMIAGAAKGPTAKPIDQPPAALPAAPVARPEPKGEPNMEPKPRQKRKGNGKVKGKRKAERA